MKRRITFLSAALMLLAFLAVPLGMRGQTTHTIGWGTASGEEGTYTNFTATSGEVAGVLSFSTEKNSSQTNPAYNANASELRLYFHSSGDGGSITISPVSGITITDAVMTTSTSPSVAYYVDGGSAVSVSASNNTYTISGISASTSLKIQNVNTSNTQLRIKTIALTYTTDGTQPTTYTVTYHANVTGIDDVVDTYNEGANVTLRAANTFTNEGYTFEEWNTDATGDGDAYEAGYQIEGIDEDLEFYAIWTENTTPGGGEVVDVLNWAATGSPTNYTDWTYTAPSGAAYAGQSSGTYQSIQLRSNNNNSGIVTTASAGKVTKVTVTWNSNTASGRTLNVYGKNTAYSAATDLYGNNAGTLIGTIVCGTSTELNITDDYEFIGMRSANAAMYLDEIDITWTSGSNPAVATTTVINVPEGFNNDIYQGTEAGTLTATVSAGETTLEAATVTWTSSNEAVATIDENGHVTLVAVGTTTITASYVGEEGVYRPSTATYQLTVVNTDPDVPGTLNNPYTVAQARAAIDAGVGVDGVYATGIVSAIVTEYSSQYENITFDIVDAAGDEAYLRAYRCGGDEAANVTVGDVAVVYGNLIYYTTQGIYEFAQGCEVVSLTHPVVPVVPSITVNPATVSVDAEEAEGALDITYENLTITEANDFEIQYYNAQGEEIDEPDWISAEVNEKELSKDDATYYEVTYVIAANNGEARTAYFKVYAMDDETNLVYSNIVTINQAAYEAPVASITFDPDSLIFDSELHYDGTMPFTYENIIVENAQSFGLQFYTAEGEETVMPEWFFAMVTPRSDENNGEYQVSCAIMANEGEARSVYFKVYAFDADSIPVYSNLATVNQAAPVFDYAVLPFVWEGGSSTDFLALNGVTAYGLGNDYASGNAPYLIKFDGTGDYIQVKTDSQPGTVTIGVKMIGGGNTSTITIQGSADGETFTDIETLTISGAQNDTLTLETTNVFDGNDRYVRMLFTKGSNVGVGPITITKGTVPSITLTPDIFELEAVGPLNGMHLPSMMVYCHNLEIAQASDFNYQFYNAEGEEQEMPEWILHSEVSLITETGYQAICIVTANEGPARSAYFKLYAFDADSIPVYSNLVTINQAGVPQQYTLTVEPFENLDLITFVNDEMVMEGDGEITVTEGNQVMLSIVAMEGYVMETLMVNGVDHVNDIADDFTYSFEMPAENVTISATAVEDVPQTPGEWVMVSLNDLTENDVFVIVGVYDVDESSYAMPNNSTGAPSAVEVTMVGNTLSGDIDDNLQWNLSIGEDGYTFYPNGETETWLYCTNTNNGVRVGTNENNVFSMTSEGYLFNNATERYIGIYNSQDWRCYTSINNNIKEQTFAFYKRVDGSEIETYTMDITGYGDSDGGYYLIASPVSMIRPTADNGFLTEEYDLYRFDQTYSGEEWRNYKAKHFNIASGKGYLYASLENTTLTFTGVPYNGNGEVALDYTEGASFAGWNLIGNPFGNAATIDKAYYRLNADGSEVNATTESSAIAAMEGVFVVAETVGETVTFTEQTNPNNNNEVSQISINVSMNRGESIDRAIVRFDNGNQLPKFQLNPNHTKVYFPQGENDYAIVRSANEGEMPVNFKAENNGTYTISINTENVEMDYLHLIDNMTGTDVDLLANPSYSFEAKTTDYANRFRLVFNANTVNENSNETFAYFNGSEWVISNMGEATLQVVDLMGRVLSTETVNGNAMMNINQTPGVYMLRLVNGDSVKVQKVVVR